MTEKPKRENNGHEFKIKFDNDRIRAVFQGTGKRNEMMRIIIKLAREQCPCYQHEFIQYVSFATGLTPRKVQEDYVGILVTLRILQENKLCYELGENEKLVG